MDANQGLLPAAPPVQQAPAQQPVPQPVQQQAPAPGQQPGQAPMMGRTQVERDYENNPLNDEDKDNLDKFSIMATNLIHTPGTRESILKRIKRQGSPHTELADAAYGVINRVIKQGKQEGEPFDQAVLILGGTDVVAQVVELAQAGGKLKEKPTEQDMRVITAKVVQNYYKERIASGEISKEQAARDAHLAATAQAGSEGADTSQVAQQARATQDLKGASVNAPKKGMLDSDGMQAPAPADPFKPQSTMKETLATGQGGRFNGVS